MYKKDPLLLSEIFSGNYFMKEIQKLIFLCLYLHLMLPYLHIWKN